MARQNTEMLALHTAFWPYSVLYFCLIQSLMLKLFFIDQEVRLQLIGKVVQDCLHENKMI